MAELGEIIAFGEYGEDAECPFSHKKVKKEKDNVMPKSWGKNDAHTLGTNLGDQYHFKQNIKFDLWDEKHEAQYTPHHLIPGNASWPETKLQKWVEKGVSNHIKYNYGYDVNGRNNGVSLPGNNGFKKMSGESWSNLHPDNQAEYAIECMEQTPTQRQFHDAHPAYNEFVINSLDKIAAKLENRKKRKGTPGCGKKDCQGDTITRKPYEPPLFLLLRLKSVALRLEGYLTGHPRKWKMPIYTSRFALMYKLKIEEEDASKKLKTALDEEKKART